MSMADRIAVMRGGVVEQVGPPTELYDQPATEFVAGFVGTTNRLHGRIEERDGAAYRVRLDAGATVTVGTPRGFAQGQRVVMCARPEQLELRPAEDADPAAWPARLRLSLPLGPALIHDVESGAAEMKLQQPRLGAPPPPGPVRIALVPGAQPSLFPEGESA